MIINMGLMSKLNKMKSFLFDEEDDEKEVKKQPKKPVKKEDVIPVRKEPIKPVKTEEDEKIEELYFEDEKEDKIITGNTEIKSRALKTEEKFKFPEFDDDDFMVVSKKPEPIIPTKKEEPKRTLYQGSKRKEEAKKFKPSPIISPVYGLLDSQGNMIKEEEKTDKAPLYNEEKTFDEVRKKAYGKLDEELENTMKRLSKKTIEEAEKDMLDEEKLSRQKKHQKKEEKVSLVALEKETDDDDDDDDMILPNVNFKEIDVDKEKEKSLKNQTKKTVKPKVEDNDDDDDDDTKEQDLFNLIDTMYQNKEDKD